MDIFVAIYLTPGEKVMGVNAEKLTNLGAFPKLSQMPWAVAADWNVTPSDLRRSKWPDLLGGY
eukprot:9189176-Pyramimonas_sp.AAC.1